MLMPNSLMAVPDLKAAYHLVRYSGCRGDTRFLVRWVTNYSKTWYVARQTMQNGCGPSDCSEWYDKSLMALCVGGHVGHFAAQFGHKVSNTVLTDAVVVYASEKLNVDAGSYVDDFMHSIAVLLHELCAGLAGGCPICAAALVAAQPLFDALDHMMTDWALIFSTKGGMSIAQRHIFLGIIFYTRSGSPLYHS